MTEQQQIDYEGQGFLVIDDALRKAAAVGEVKELVQQRMQS